MSINSYFFNAILSEGVYDRIYNAEDVTNYLNLLVGNGVFPNPSTMLQVRASSGMNVIVGAGSGWINGHKLVNTADMTLSVTASDVVLNRIDAVIFYLDLSTRTMGIEMKNGTPSSIPVAPTMTRTNNRYEMCLAQISIPKQTTEITAAMITDTRMNSAVCGYVQGLIQQIDTTTLWNQQQAQFNDWMNSVQTQFDQFKTFRKLEGIYTTQSANESTFNVQSLVPEFSSAYDVLEVYINGIHLTGDEYTLTNNVVTLETPIEKAGAVVDFVVYHVVNDEE